MRRCCVLLAVALAVFSGCGSGSANGLTQGQQQALIAELEAVKASAATGDLGSTASALRKFRATVARLNRDGAISDAAARKLRVGAARILARAKSDSAPPPQPTVTQTAPAPAPVPKKKPKPPHGHGHGHGKDKGHGHGHGKGGD